MTDAKLKSKSGSVAADRLKSFIERIENLREEKKAIGSDERDVFSEAKGVGFDAKAMREVLKRRAMDASDRDEWDTLIDTYEHALGARGEAARIVGSGGTYDEAAAKTGVGRATVARTVAGIKNLENETPAPPHAPETGVIIEVPAASRSDASAEGDSERRSDPVGCDGADTISDAAPRGCVDDGCFVVPPGSTPQPLSEGGDGIGHQYFDVVPPNIAAAVVRGDAGWAEGISLKRTPACNDPRPATWQGITLSRDAFEAEREAAREAERVRRRAEHAKAAARNAEIDADPLTIPAFLRKQVAASVT